MTLGSKSGCKPSRRPNFAHKSHRGELLLHPKNARIASGIGSISGSSSSRHVQHNFTKICGARRTKNQETLDATEIQARTAKDHLEYQERTDFMTTAERRNIAVLRSAVPQAEDDDGQPALDILDILSGQDSVDISHVGGEFADFLAFGDDLLGPSAWYVLYTSTLACKP